MMWVIRAGHKGLHYDKYIKNSKVYLSWDGYRMDLSKVNTLADFRIIVEEEKGTNNRTSVSNWAGQLYSFSQEIKIGDYVLIPSIGSRTYCLAKVTGEYAFDENETDKLYHSRNIEILESGIPIDIFTQSVIYSLRAYRTIFKAHHENEIMKAIKEWKEKRG